MMRIKDPRERPRQHDDRRDGHRDGQAADEQDSLRSTLHRRIPISMGALGPGAHPELSRNWSCETFIARFIVRPLYRLSVARAQTWRREHPCGATVASRTLEFTSALTLVTFGDEFQSIDEVRFLVREFQDLDGVPALPMNDLLLEFNHPDHLQVSSIDEVTSL